MKMFRVERGPVSLPGSLYGAARTLATGETFRSGGNSWIVRQVARGRIAEAAAGTGTVAGTGTAAVAVADADPVAAAEPVAAAGPVAVAGPVAAAEVEHG